jgi:hypothetical protein
MIKRYYLSLFKFNSNLFYSGQSYSRYREWSKYVNSLIISSYGVVIVDD